jgi:hypothetical protein
MPKLKMELGAEPKKVILLGGLILVAAYLYFSGMSDIPDSGPGRPATSAKAPAAKANSPLRPAAQADLDPARPSPKASTARAQRKDFRPSLAARKGEERDPARIDPTLRLDLLEKVAAVPMKTGGRSLFDFGPDATAAAPKPVLPEPKIVVKKELRMHGPEPAPPPPPPPVKPPPPPITLKFYGANLPQRGGAKRVFCMQGEEILTPSEGDLIQRRYRIVKINPTSVLVEDVDHKHQQLIPIDEPPKG